MKKLAIFLTFVAAGYCIMATCYFLTDSAYERLVSQAPSNKAEVESCLTDFRGNLILDAEKMSPVLRGRVTPDLEYWRYTKYPGFSIDVIYDKEAKVRSLWPEYE